MPRSNRSKAKNHMKRWTEAEYLKAWYLYEAHNCWDEIGKQLGRSPGSIVLKIKALTKRHNFPPNEGNQWSHAEDNEITKLHESNNSNLKIAMKLKRRTSSISERIKRICTINTNENTKNRTNIHKYNTRLNRKHRRDNKYNKNNKNKNTNKSINRHKYNTRNNRKNNKYNFVVYDLETSESESEPEPETDSFSESESELDSEKESEQIHQPPQQPPIPPPPPPPPQQQQHANINDDQVIQVERKENRFDDNNIGRISGLLAVNLNNKDVIAISSDSEQENEEKEEEEDDDIIILNVKKPKYSNKKEKEEEDGDIIILNTKKAKYSNKKRKIMETKIEVKRFKFDNNYNNRHHKPPPIVPYTFEEVLTYFYLLGYGRYVSVIEKGLDYNGIYNVRELKSLDVDILRKCGIQSYADRKDIVAKIETHFPHCYT